MISHTTWLSRDCFLFKKTHGFSFSRLHVLPPRLQLLPPLCVCVESNFTNSVSLTCSCCCCITRGRIWSKVINDFHPMAFLSFLLFFANRLIARLECATKSRPSRINVQPTGPVRPVSVPAAAPARIESTTTATTNAITKRPTIHLCSLHKRQPKVLLLLLLFPCLKNHRSFLFFS